MASIVPPFVIPQRDDDLLVVSDINYYVSELVNDERKIDEALTAFQREVTNGDFELIMELFDHFFPLIRNDEQIRPHLRIHLFDLLANGLQNILETLKGMDLSDPENVTDKDLNRRYSNCLLMHVYLLAGLTNQFENHVNTQIKTRAALTTTTRGKRKAHNQGDQPSEDLVEEFWVLDDKRSKFTRLLFKVMEATESIKFIWTANRIDDSFKKCILSTICKFLENPETCKASGRTILFNAFELLRFICVNWDMYKVVARALMDLAPKLDYFQASQAISFPFVEAIFHIQTEAELEPLIREMIAYGSRLDTEASSAKTESASRAFSLFLRAIAERSADTLFKNLAFIYPFLNCDPPILRNSVLVVFTEIILRCLCNKELDERLEDQKNMLFQSLMDHIVDKTAMVRANALNLWRKLAREKAIPTIQFRLGLLSESRGRLNDDSVMVRKAAASLMIALIIYNEFGSDLNYGAWYEDFVRWSEAKNEHLKRKPTGPYAFEDAYNAVGDERILLEDDRMNEFERELKAIDVRIETQIDALLFITEMEKSMALALSSVRRSQKELEMDELMGFICECCKFHVRESMNALKRMFNLIWRKDPKIVESVVEMAHEALFSKNENKDIAHRKTAQNLVEAMNGCTDEERISLEETIIQVFKKKGIASAILDEFWKYSKENNPAPMRLGAARLIVVVAKANKSLVHPHMERLYELYGTNTEQIRIEVLRVLMALADLPEKNNAGEEQQCQLLPTHKFITLMSTFIVSELNRNEAKRWTPHCRQVVNIIYDACARPTNVISHLFDKIIEKTDECIEQVMNPLTQQTEEAKNERRAELELNMARLFYFVGEVVLKFLSYAEATFAAKFRDCSKKMHGMNLAQHPDTPGPGPSSRMSNESAEKNEDELGLGIPEEEKIQMRLQKILDNDTFAQDNIIGRTLPLLLSVLEKCETWSTMLVESAMLALSKLMLVNQRCCKIFLPEFFKFYESASVRLRNNMIIMMTDLCFRFPNVFNEFNDEFITKVRDDNAGVRYTSLLVSSHMLLNDQLKITSNIVHLAYCLTDEEPHIKTLAHGFFCELKNKHNVLYNHIPAIVDKLVEDPDFDSRKLEEVLNFLLQLVEKDAQKEKEKKEKLVDKLVERFEQIANFRCIASVLKAKKEREEGRPASAAGSAKKPAGGRSKRKKN